jgi:predicted GIY-YIG superfamily endonuclease
MMEEREDFFDALREEIASKMEHLDNAKKRFITEKDQKAIWSTHAKTILHYIGLKDDIQERIEQHFLKTVMILVKIGWKKWDTFGRIFLETKNRTDEENFCCKFPELASESFLNSREKAQCFVDNRSYFRPWVIKKSGIEDLDDLVWRLPFLEGEKELGKGASGKVTKELIAAKHFLIDRDSENKVI